MKYIFKHKYKIAQRETGHSQVKLNQWYFRERQSLKSSDEYYNEKALIQSDQSLFVVTF